MTPELRGDAYNIDKPSRPLALDVRLSPAKEHVILAGNDSDLLSTY